MKQFASIILLMLAIAIPVGVAAQNIVAWLALITWGGLLFFERKKTADLTSDRAPIWRSLVWTTIFAAGYILWLGLASWFNAKNPATLKDWLGAVLGYAPWIALPLLALALKMRGIFEPETLRRVRTYFFYGIVPFWACVVLTQFLFGWSFSGSEMVWGSGRIDMYRPRGFYSHPLSLAYAALLVWPFALNEMRGFGKSLLPMVAVGTIVVLSASRTVHAVAILLILTWALIALFKKQKSVVLFALIGTTALGGAILLTSATKWQDTISEQGHDVGSDYRDDRLAFWHAHWEMFKERPLLGHGWKLGTEYRSPYYAKIGLADFSKKYEAHNLYLQVLVNGGCVGFLLFFMWALGVFRIARGSVEFVVMLLGIGVASITQNSLQDFEVRFVFTVLFILILGRVDDLENIL